MKRITALFFAIWLFLGSLFPQTDLEELCKVPMLWVHYQSAHAELSFTAYLQMHYQETHQQDCAHESLPMQNHAHTASSLFFIPLDFTIVLPALPTSIQVVVFTVFRQEHYRFQPENSLFSPPKQLV